MPHRSLSLLLLLSVLLSACGPGQLFGPTITPTATSTPIPTATLTPTATSTPTPSPTPIVYDGEWSGETSAGGAVSFVVVNNGVSVITINFGLGSRNVSCNVNMKVEMAEPLTIAFEKFSLESSSMQFAGVFDSPATASGTVSASQDSPNCKGGVDLTWTAERE